MYRQIINIYTGELADAILRTADNTWIPNDLENSDWQAYLAWLAEGNTPLPPEGN